MTIERYEITPSFASVNVRVFLLSKILFEDLNQAKTNNECSLLQSKLLYNSIEFVIERIAIFLWFQWYVSFHPRATLSKVYNFHHTRLEISCRHERLDINQMWISLSASKEEGFFALQTMSFAVISSQKTLI